MKGPGALALSVAAYALSAGLGGCGVHYYDPDSGVDHVWGIGHLQMKLATPEEGVRAAVTGVQLIGFGIGAGRSDYYAQIGWRDARMLRVLQESTCVRLDWPTSDIFSIRVGTVPPYAKDDPILSPHVLEELCR